LRILYVQKEVEHRVMTMLTGAMQTLRVGDPWHVSTDVGPLIDDEAHAAISAYCAGSDAAGKLVARAPAPQGGRFLAPCILSVPGIEALEVRPRPLALFLDRWMTRFRKRGRFADKREPA